MTCLLATVLAPKPLFLSFLYSTQWSTSLRPDKDFLHQCRRMFCKEESTPSLVFTEVLRSLLLREETWSMDIAEAYVRSHRAETKARSCS